MNKFVSICLLFVAVYASEDGLMMCPRDLQTIAFCRYTGEEVGEPGLYNDKDLCRKASSECCWREIDDGYGLCLRIPRSGGGESPAEPNFNIPNYVRSSFKRSWFPYPGCEVPLEFPDNCKPHKHSLFVMEPPMDIPYCVRIPCSLNSNKQRVLDSDHFKCGSEPGCYFDRELYEYRDAFGDGHLPGIPICHLAIRSQIFQEKAKDVIKTYGFWNPFFTECILDTFHDDFKKGPEGCKLLPLLELFHVSPKLAGWGGITPSACAYIGACWVNRKGCLYPMNPDKLIVKSGQNNKYDALDIPFGRPKCQYFNPSTPYSVLKSYAQCLSAGCTLDFSYTIKYYDYLFNLGDTMTAEDHWLYWEQVLLGMVGPHNLDDLPWKFDKSIGFDAPKPKLPRLPDFKTMQANALTRGFFPPPISKNTKPCGYPFKAYNFRPCAPPEFPDLHYNRMCPYQPFHPPRFPKLKGSLKGCCDINPCYIPRRDIQHAYSGPTYYYTEWTPYTECSKGDRYIERTRKCITKRSELCKEPTKQRKRCERPAEWGEWEPWTSCETFNFCDQKTRVRYCLPRGSVCDGKKREEQSDFCYPQMRSFC